MAWNDTPPTAAELKTSQAWDATPPTPEELGQSENPKPGIMSQAWDSLKIPEQLSSQGLNQLSSMVPNPEPTGNLPTDILKGTPKIAADTLAQVAPSFVGRGAILGTVAGKALQMMPESAVNFVGNQAARLGKVLSGNRVQDIKDLFEDPAALLGAKSMSKAKEIYGAAVKGAGEMPPVDAETAFDSATKIAQSALEKAANGTLQPLEALEGRQNLDTLIRATRGPEGKLNVNTSRLKKLLELRQDLDSVVKSDPGLDEADQIYARAKLASKFRHAFPVTQGGKASDIKNIISGAAMTAMHGNPIVPIAMSPATIGAVTSSLGLLNKAMPYISSALPQVGQLVGVGMGLLGKSKE